MNKFVQSGIISIFSRLSLNMLSFSWIFSVCRNLVLCAHCTSMNSPSTQKKEGFLLLLAGFFFFAVSLRRKCTWRWANRINYMPCRLQSTATVTVLLYFICVFSVFFSLASQYLWLQWINYAYRTSAHSVQQ